MNFVKSLLGLIALLPAVVAAQSSLPVLISKRLPSAGLGESLSARFATNRGAAVLFSGGGTNASLDNGNVLKQDLYVWDRIAGTTERLGLKEASGTERGFGGVRAVSDDLRFIIVGSDAEFWSRDRLSTGWKRESSRTTFLNGKDFPGVISRDGRVAQTERVTLANGYTINRLRIGTVPGSSNVVRIPLGINGVQLSIRFAQISSDGLSVAGLAIVPGNEQVRATGYVFWYPLNQQGVGRLIPVEAMPEYQSTQCLSRNGRYFAFYGAFGTQSPWLHIYDFVENRWQRLFRENPWAYDVKGIHAISDSANLATMTFSLNSQPARTCTQELATGKNYGSTYLYAAWPDIQSSPAIMSPDGEYLAYPDYLPPRTAQGFILNHRRSNKWWRYEKEFGEGGIPGYNPIAKLGQYIYATPEMSEDATRFAWISNADAIAQGDTNPLSGSGGYDIFFSDTKTGRRVCVTAGVTPNAELPQMRMDYAGRKIVYSTNGFSQLARTDVYVYDTATNTRSIVALDAREPAISGDGKVVTYVRETNLARKVYRQDLALGIETFVADGWRPEMDGTGLHIAFLAPLDSNSGSPAVGHFRDGTNGRVSRIFSSSAGNFNRSLFISRDGTKFLTRFGDYYDRRAQRRFTRTSTSFGYADPDLNYAVGYDYSTRETSAFKVATGRQFPLTDAKRNPSEGFSEQPIKLPYIQYTTDFGDFLPPNIYRVSLFTTTKPSVEFFDVPFKLGNTSTRFRWRGYDEVSLPERLLYRSRLNGGAWTSYTYAKELTIGPPPSGPFSVEVQSKDEAGNESVLARLTYGFG